MENKFTHLQSAHCENGVTANLLKQAGHSFMTEPLAFGLGSGLFYVYLPFIKVGTGPGISFRTMPGMIFKRTCNSLQIDVKSEKFRNEAQAEKALDNLLADGHLVGCQVGVYNLSYFPVEYRFHFNAHNLIVYGREGDNYLVSDPTMDTVTTLTADQLREVRFAKGILAPRGHLYYIKNINPITDDIIRAGISKGIKRNVRDMLHIPGNFGGVAGIQYTAGKVRKWRDKLGVRRSGQYFGQLIRMQEEIGTGGGGFRFIYAAFLEQATEYIKNDTLLNISDDFTKAGDLWRHNAVNMAGVLRGRNTEQKDFDNIADVMLEIFAIEKQAFKKLSKIKLV